MMLNPAYAPPPASAGAPGEWGGALAVLLRNAARISADAPRTPENRFHRELIGALAAHVRSQHGVNAGLREATCADFAAVLGAPSMRRQGAPDIDAIAARAAQLFDFSHFGVAVRRFPGRPLRAAFAGDAGRDCNAPLLGLVGLAVPNRHYAPSECLVSAKTAPAVLRAHCPAGWSDYLEVREYGQHLPSLEIDLLSAPAGRGEYLTQVTRAENATVGALLAALVEPRVHKRIEDHIAWARRIHALAPATPTPASVVQPAPPTPARARRHCP